MLCDLSGNCPDPAKYDQVIVGGSVYAGKIRKPVTRFCSENIDTLKGKKLGLFICGMADGDGVRKQLESSFPKELLAAAADAADGSGLMAGSVSRIRNRGIAACCLRY